MTETTDRFKALSDHNRLKILDILLSHDLCVGALASRLGISKPAVSQHLGVLRRAGLVRGEKRGYWTHYTVNRTALVDMADALNRMADQRERPDGTCSRTLPMVETTMKERRELDMCTDCCQQPEKLEGKPGDCTPEQIKACHGDMQDHPCEVETAPEDPE